MSWSPCPDPTLAVPATVDAIEVLIVPRAVDLGGLEVRRALPSTKRQMVGPFIFFVRGRSFNLDSSLSSVRTTRSRSVRRVPRA